MDPYERPPETIRLLYKRYQPMDSVALDADRSLLDLEKEICDPHKSRVHAVDRFRDKREILETMNSFLQSFPIDGVDTNTALADANLQLSVLKHDAVPGLLILPCVLPPIVQSTLLSCLLHRDLSNPAHNTNIHLHHKLTYPSNGSSSVTERSFFSIPPSSSIYYEPKNLESHKPLSHKSLLTRKLRWFTLGGQYDWTAKRYPATKPPPMPLDVASMLHGLFPTMKPQAAIVNLYSPGDTLSVHRDVSEDSSAGLVSVSLGSDGIFVIGNAGSEAIAIRLRSGDALLMGGESRFAWHGVPKIVPNTCPTWLANWPAAPDARNCDQGVKRSEYEPWRGWMAGKRINLNVRQMWD